MPRSDSYSINACVASYKLRQQLVPDVRQSARLELSPPKHIDSGQEHLLARTKEVHRRERDLRLSQVVPLNMPHRRRFTSGDLPKVSEVSVIARYSSQREYRSEVTLNRC